MNIGLVLTRPGHVFTPKTPRQVRCTPGIFPLKKNIYIYIYIYTYIHTYILFGLQKYTLLMAVHYENVSTLMWFVKLPSATTSDLCCHSFTSEQASEDLVSNILESTIFRIL